MVLNQNDEVLKDLDKKKTSMEKFNALRALAMGFMQQSAQNQANKEHQSWLSKVFDFLFHHKKKHHHSGNQSQPQEEPNVVDETLKLPDEDIDSTITKKTSGKFIIDINLDGPDIEVRLNLESTKPGVILSSSNPEHYGFYEARNVEGVQKEATYLTADEKNNYAKTMADIEREAYTRTATEMGFDIKARDLGDGKTEYTIRDPKNNNEPITAEQMAEFKERSSHIFNEIANDRLRNANMSITKECSAHPQPTPSTGNNEPEPPIISFSSSIPTPGETPSLSMR